MTDLRTKEAIEIMLSFAERTGVTSGRTPRRYLWTDAFAVCNLLGLYRETGEDGFLKFALELVHQVHDVLGRHRNDDARSGWISGLPDSQAELHPTIGGLRIGKKLPNAELINHRIRDWSGIRTASTSTT